MLEAHLVVPVWRVVRLAAPDHYEWMVARAERRRPAVEPENELDDGDMEHGDGVAAVRDEHSRFLCDGLEEVKYDAGVDKERDAAH